MLRATGTRFSGSFDMRWRWVLIGIAAAEMYDIQGKLYKDENCFEDAGAHLFAAGTCYSNTWTNESKGFTLHVVRLTKPRQMTITLYSDHCKNEIGSRYIYEEECDKFMGDVYGRFSIMQRSNCYGKRDCKSIVTAEQVFYDQMNCRGLTIMDQEFPVGTLNPQYAQSFGSLPTIGMEAYDETSDAGYDFGPGAVAPASDEFKYSGQNSVPSTFPIPQAANGDHCLRAINGTVMYLRNVNGSQIHEFLFDLSPDCTPLVGYRWYAYTLGYCYPIQNGFSYKWYTQKRIVESFSAALYFLV